MSIILITAGFIFLWLLIRYEANRAVRNILINNSIQPQQKTSYDKEKELHKNRFIYWHKEKESGEELERSMNKAIEEMQKKKQASKEQEYQEYLDWCKANGIKPRYNSPHDIDHAY